MSAVDEWLKTNRPTRAVVTYWRRYIAPPDASNGRAEQAASYHLCKADGTPVCRCGMRAHEAGNLGPLLERTKRPPLACNLSRSQSVRVPARLVR